MDDVVGGGAMNALGTAFGSIATGLKSLDIGAVFSAIANFCTIMAYFITTWYWFNAIKTCFNWC